MKRKNISVLVCILAFIMVLSGCGRSGNSGETMEQAGSSAAAETAEEDCIVVGFSQVGAESYWRNANTQSMIDAFEEAPGYKLIIEDGQQKQVNQIRAIRTFIQKGVDYIVLAPVTEEGWDTVLQEARDAGIPVIIVDRQVKVEDQELYTCWVGSDFELEGKKVVKWLHDYTKKRGIYPSDINIVALQGTLGASAQIGRTRSLEEAVKNFGWNFMGAASADFTQTRGKEVMQFFLKAYPELNVVYCENDSEAIGAIEAIEAAGRKAGSNLGSGEIMVVSFDGVNPEAMQYVIEDKISMIAECNPLHGPRVHVIIEQLEKGKSVQKHLYVSEGAYTHDELIPSVYIGGKQHHFTKVTKELLVNRIY